MNADVSNPMLGAERLRDDLDDAFSRLVEALDEKVAREFGGPSTEERLAGQEFDEPLVDQFCWWLAENPWRMAALAVFGAGIAAGAMVVLSGQ